jgi:integrase
LHNIIRTLSVIFSQAIEDGLASHNPATKPSKLVRLKNVGEHREVFDHDEELLILQTEKQYCPLYYPFVLTLFRTGLREGEAVALMPTDLDFRGRYALIERNFTAGQLEDSPKSGKRREIDLAQDLATVLKEHLALQEAEAALIGKIRSKWLFSTPNGTIIRSNNFRDRVWRPMLKKAGLRYRTIHATRHTFATRLITEGAPLTYVQKQLGHSSIQITVDLYFHWIKRTERSRTLDVDRLIRSHGESVEVESEGGTSGGTRPLWAGQHIEN